VKTGSDYCRSDFAKALILRSLDNAEEKEFHVDNPLQ